MKTVFIAFFFFLSLPLFAQVNDADAFFKGTYDKSFIRRHKIRQVSVASVINDKKSSKFILEFNSSGYLQKETVYDSNNIKLHTLTFRYNQYGDQAERTEVNYELNKTYHNTFNRIYKSSLLIQESSTDLPFIITYTYNDKRKKVQSILYQQIDTSKSAKLISTYIYDAAGKLKYIQETQNNNNGSPPFIVRTTEFIYNKVGQVSSVVLSGKSTYELVHDKKGLLQSTTKRMLGEFSGITIVEKYSYTFFTKK